MTQMTPDDDVRAGGSGAGRTQAAAEDDDLQESLAGLSQLTMNTLSLEDMLTHVADFAVRAIPGADGAGLTLLEDGRSDTIVATAEFVRQIDAVQYGLGEGPCISAAAENRTFRSGSIGEDQTWPRFGRRVLRLDVHSVLSLPLATPAGVLGAMNVYAHERDAFTERAVELGELFAVPAAVSVHNAQALAQAKRLTAQLQAGLTNRAVIDQALGILMSRTGATPQEAFDRLRIISQKENRKLSAVADATVAEAVRRARARHAAS